MMYRQVHPNWVDDGRPSSQAFRPTKKDEKMLSVARGSMTSPEGAFRHYRETRGLQSAGTWGVTVGEAGAVELGCPADPVPGDPCHALIDFRGLSRGKAQA